MFFVLQGSGELKMRNDRYLAVSTKQAPAVVDYPDSGKFGILSEVPGPTGAAPKRFMFLGRAEESLSYWDGE